MSPRAPCPRLALPLLFAALAALLSGCMSMVGLGYGHAETVAAWKADQYFDLDAEQERQFSDRFAALYAWHRYEELPEYVGFLGTAGYRLERGLKPADIEWFTEGLKARYRRVVQRAAGDAADLLATLTPGQIEHLKQRWQSDNRKFAADHKVDGTPEERRQARAKRLVNQVKNWAGSLTGEQERRISALAHALPDTERMRHEDRMRRQREFAQLLDARTGDRAAFRAKLASWLADWERGRDPTYARLSETSWQQRMELYVAVWRLLTPEQRTNVAERLQNHISEFRRLSQPG